VGGGKQAGRQEERKPERKAKKIKKIRRRKNGQGRKFKGGQLHTRACVQSS
jgi:hypothetical protein